MLSELPSTSGHPLQTATWHSDETTMMSLLCWRNIGNGRRPRPHEASRIFLGQALLGLCLLSLAFVHNFLDQGRLWFNPLPLDSFYGGRLCLLLRSPRRCPPFYHRILLIDWFCCTHYLDVNHAFFLLLIPELQARESARSLAWKYQAPRQIVEISTDQT